MRRALRLVPFLLIMSVQDAAFIHFYPRNRKVTDVSLSMPLSKCPLRLSWHQMLSTIPSLAFIPLWNSVLQHSVAAHTWTAPAMYHTYRSHWRLQWQGWSYVTGWLLLDSVIKGQVGLGLDVGLGHIKMTSAHLMHFHSSIWGQKDLYSKYFSWGFAMIGMSQWRGLGHCDFYGQIKWILYLPAEHIHTHQPTNLVSWNHAYTENIIHMALC